MKAVLVDRTAAKATIRLVPSWLERLFGSREFLIELVWNSAPTYESLSREEFHARLRGSRSGQPERRGLPGRVVVRVLAAP